MAIQMRRGTRWQRLDSEEILESGQPYVDTDTGYLFIGDGETALKDLARVIRPKVMHTPVLVFYYDGNPSTNSVLGVSDITTTYSVKDFYSLRVGDTVRVNAAMGTGQYYPLTLSYIISPTGNPLDGGSMLPEEYDNVSSNVYEQYYWGQIYGGLWGCLRLQFTYDPDTGSGEWVGKTWTTETGANCRYLIADEEYTSTQSVYGDLDVGGQLSVGSVAIKPLYRHDVTAVVENSIIARVFFYSASSAESTPQDIYMGGVSPTQMFSAGSLRPTSTNAPFRNVSGYIRLNGSTFESGITYVCPVIGFANSNGLIGFYYIETAGFIGTQVFSRSSWSWEDNVTQVI